MKRTIGRTLGSAAVAGAFMLGMAGVARADVLDFEGLTNQGAQSLNAATSNYGGFSWSNSWTLFDTNIYGVQVSSGNYGIVNDNGIDPITISSSTAFTFNGFSINKWSFNAPSSVTINAFDSSSTLVGTDTITLTPTSTFVSENWANVTTLSISGGQFFAIDDFTYNTSPVPEPETYAMMLAGLGLLGFAARRRKQKEAAAA